VATARIGLLDAEHIAGLPLPVAAVGMYAVSALLVIAPLALYSAAITELTLA
jgi:hypothetical protein